MKFGLKRERVMRYSTLKLMQKKHWVRKSCWGGRITSKKDIKNQTNDTQSHVYAH